MNYKIEKKQEKIIFIELEGKLLGNNQDVLLLDQVEEYQQNGVKYAAIDLSKLDMINSAGIGLLMRLLVRFRNIGGEVCLIRPSESIQKMLIITKLVAIFSIVENEEEALKCFLS